MAHVTAYRRRDGKKVSVPEHWLDHKVLGKPFRRNKPAPVSPKLAPAEGVGGTQKKEA